MSCKSFETAYARVIVVYNEAVLAIKKYSDCKTDAELQELLEYRSKKGQLRFAGVGLSRIVDRTGTHYVLRIRIRGYRTFKWEMRNGGIYAEGIDGLPYVVILKMFVAMFDRIRYSQYIDNDLPIYDMNYQVYNGSGTVVGLVSCSIMGVVKFTDYR